MKQRIFALLIGFFLLCPISSLAEMQYPSDEWYPYYDEAAKLYGFMDVSGKPILPPAYPYLPWAFCGGRAIVSTDQGYGVIDETGAWVAQPIYDQVLSEYTRELALFMRGDMYCYVDKSGREVFSWLSQWVPEQAPPPEISDLWPSDALMRGNNSQGVRFLQEQLLRLGYLTDAPDGEYGPKTEAAVKAWQESIGEETSGEISTAQLVALTEGTETVIHPQTNAYLVDRVNWTTADGLQSDYQFQLTNASERVLDSVTLALYYIDDNGAQTGSETEFWTFTSNVVIAPGQTADMRSIRMPAPLASLYVGVYQTHYQDDSYAVTQKDGIEFMHWARIGR